MSSPYRKNKELHEVSMTYPTFSSAPPVEKSDDGMQYDGHHDHYHAEEQPRVDDFRVGRRGQLLQTIW